MLSDSFCLTASATRHKCRWADSQVSAHAGMKIGLVRMSVDRRIVDMPVAMPAHSDARGMLVVMMRVVGPMPVIVFDPGVQVLMRVLFKDESSQ